MRGILNDFSFCRFLTTFSWSGGITVGLGRGFGTCGFGVDEEGMVERGFGDDETEGLDYEDAGGLEVRGTGVVGGVFSAVATLDVDVFFDAAVMGYDVGE